MLNLIKVFRTACQPTAAPPQKKVGFEQELNYLAFVDVSCFESSLCVLNISRYLRNL